MITDKRTAFWRKIERSTGSNGTMENRGTVPLATLLGDLGQVAGFFVEREMVLAEFNNRNYFSEEVAPVVTVDQAVKGAVSKVLTLEGRPLLRDAPEYISKGRFDVWVSLALSTAQSIVGKRHPKGANWWK